MPKPRPSSTRPLGVEIKARVSLQTKEQLAALAAERTEGTNVSHILREAVSEYLARRTEDGGPPAKKKR